MQKNKLISVNEETYNLLKEERNKMNEKSIVRYSMGNVIHLGLEALRGGKENEEER